MNKFITTCPSCNNKQLNEVEPFAEITCNSCGADFPRKGNCQATYEVNGTFNTFEHMAKTSKRDW